MHVAIGISDRTDSNQTDLERKRGRSSNLYGKQVKLSVVLKEMKGYL